MPDNNNPSLGTPCEACTEIRETEAEEYRKLLTEAVLLIGVYHSVVMTLVPPTNSAVQKVEDFLQRVKGKV